MEIIKVPLNTRPVDVENSFEKLDPKKLKLSTLENVNKLKPNLKKTQTLNMSQLPQQSEVEKKVAEVLKFSKKENLENQIPNDEVIDLNKENDINSENNFEFENFQNEFNEPDRLSVNNDTFPPENINQYLPENKYQSKTNLVEEEEDDEEEEEEKPQVDLTEERSDLMWSLKKLKKYHDIKSFPHYDEFTSIEDLKRILKEVKREVILDENVNKNKEIITFCWLIMEKVCTEYLSLDMGGFSQHEMQHINDYHKILVEISERKYLNWSDGLPPEVKLICTTLFHALLFHVKKTNTASTLIDYIGVLGQKIPDANANSEMRGPSKFF